MARIRSIKPETFWSQSLAAVSLQAERTFVGLWTQADDMGRAVGDARLIKGQLWPLRDEVSPNDIAVYLAELEDEGMICRYEIDGRPYLHILTWAKHQNVYHPGPAKHPSCPLHPEDDDPDRESRKSTRESRVGKGKGMGKGKGSEVTPSAPGAQLALVATPDGAADRDRRGSFDEFWSAYPRKVGKDAARRAWVSAIKREDAAVILAGLAQYASDPNLPEKTFIPHAATWLNGGRWDDEPCPARNVPARLHSANDDKIRSALARADAMDTSALGF